MVSGFMASTGLGTAVNCGIMKALLYSVRAWPFDDISWYRTKAGKIKKE